MGKVDRFHDYLDHCENVALIGPGEYIEMVAPSEKLAWTRLVIDLRDTWKAGSLLKLRAENGSAAYVRVTK